MPSDCFPVKAWLLSHIVRIQIFIGGLLVQNLTNPPKLVIFDCDGVLVDSEPIFNRVLHEFLRSCGADMSFPECCELFTGKSRHDVELYLSNQGMRVPENWPMNFQNKALEALK
jgi:hypothetical protein